MGQFEADKIDFQFLERVKTVLGPVVDEHSELKGLIDPSVQLFENQAFPDPLTDVAINLTDESAAKLSEALHRLMTHDIQAYVLGDQGVGINWSELVSGASLSQIRNVILRMNRPVMSVQGKHVDATQAPFWVDVIEEAKRKGIFDRVMPAVGRINLSNHPTFKYCGTGFLVSRNRVVTNRHVAWNFLEKRAHFDRLKNPSGETITASINFSHDPDRDPSKEFLLEKLLYMTEVSGPDIAVFECEGVVDVDPLVLADDVTQSESIAAIGYPGDVGGGLADNVEFRNELFSREYEVKRFSPGRMHVGRFFADIQHDCSVLSGSSGSPLIEVSTGLVVGVHRQGTQHMNYGVRCPDVRNVLNSLDRQLVG